jgi:hypothetical protein
MLLRRCRGFWFFRNFLLLLSASAPAGEPAESDDWNRLWETGGFQVLVRQPLRDLDPAQAERYAQQIAPALGGLAARVSEGQEAAVVIQWD